LIAQPFLFLNFFEFDLIVFRVVDYRFGSIIEDEQAKLNHQRKGESISVKLKVSLIE